MHEILGFILPFVFASGEAVLGVLILVILFVIGRGKILRSEKVIMLERMGQYTVVLAPGLNLAQPFIEAVARQVSLCGDNNLDGLQLCFEVRDKHIATKKQPTYLLVVSQHNGALHFEAKYVSLEHTLHVNDETVLSNNRTLLEDVEDSVCAVAKSWGVNMRIKHPQVT